VKKVIAIILGIAAYYLVTVATFYVLTLLFKDSFKNICLSAVPVTLIAILLLLVNYGWKKKGHKC
jgi:hypothetical protein